MMEEVGGNKLRKISILFACFVFLVGLSGNAHAQGNWYLTDLHVHQGKSTYQDIFDLKFNETKFKEEYPNESFAAYDGISRTDHPLPDDDELNDHITYINTNYPDKFYVVGGHYHSNVIDEGGNRIEIQINIYIPYDNASALPDKYYDVEFDKWEKVTNDSYIEIVNEVHSVGGLVIWNHPMFASAGLVAWNNLYTRDKITNAVDGVELAALTGPSGAGTLTIENIIEMWSYFSLYVYSKDFLVLGITDYRVIFCKGRPECIGAEWYNNNYGSMIKASSTNDTDIFDALKNNRVVTILNSTADNKIYCFGRAEWVNDLNNSIPCNIIPVSISGKIQSPLNQSYSKGNIDFNITVNPVNQALITASVSIDGGTNNSMVNDSLTHYYNITIPTLGEGSHNATFYVNDTTGNMSSSTVYFTIDTTPPQITMNSPTNITIFDNTPILNATMIEENPDSMWYSLDVGSNETGCLYPCTTKTFEVNLPSWTVGSGGDDWSNNVTFDNTTTNDGGDVILEGQADLDANTSVLLHMNEGSGSYVNDSSTNGNDGAINTEYGYPRWVNGKFGKALKFFDIDDHVRITTDPTLDFTENITVMAWIYPYISTSKIPQHQGIVNKGTSPETSYRFINNKSVAKLRWQLNISGTGRNCDSIELIKNNWYHIAGTYNGTDMVVYVNGTAITTCSYSGTITPTSDDLFIGTLENGSVQGFDGIIDEVHILDRALNATEIANAYNNNYSSTGNVTSISMDADSIGGYVWKKIKFEGDVNSAVSSVSIYVNTSPDNVNWTGYKLVKENATSGTFYEIPTANQVRYSSWRLVLQTNDTSITPTISSVALWGSLSEGSHYVTVYANDTAGNINSTTQYFTVDTPPTITITSPPNETISDNTPDLNFTINERANTTYSWDSEGSISGCRSCISYNTTYGESTLDVNSALLMHFNENDGLTVYDDSSSNNDGIKNGSTWTTGKFGPALEFDGVDDFIEVNDSDNLRFDGVNDSFTVMLWVKTSASGFSGNKFLFNKEGTTGGDTYNGYHIFMRSYANNHNLRFMYHQGVSEALVIESTGPINDGNWHHVAVVRDVASDEGYIYIDGVLNNSAIDNSLNPEENSGNLTIGVRRKYDGILTGFFNGTIDEFHIIGRALSATEIQQEYEKVLKDGQHNVTVYANDTVGNLGNSTRWFTVDTIAPYNITLNYPGNNSNVSTRNVTFSWTSYDATSNMSSDLIIDGLVNVSNISTNNGTPTNYTVLGLSEGPHNWSIQTWDDAGNSNNSSVYEFTVDTPPTITITSPPNETISDNTPDLNLTTDEPANTTYSWDSEGSISGCRLCTSFNTTYGEAVLDANSALLMHFNEDYGNIVYDDSSSNNDGTKNGATWATGKFGYGLLFDGNDYVEVPDPADGSLDFDWQSFTIEAWIKTDDTYGIIVNKLECGACDGYHLLVTGSGTLRAMIHDVNASNNFGVKGTTPVNDSEWHHVAVVFDWGVGNGTLYVDGKFETTKAFGTAIDTPPVNDRPLYIGLLEPTWSGWNYTGIIDEVHIIRRALNASEIADIYNKTLIDGQHNVTVYANDTVGNLGNSTRWFTVDTIAPYNITLNYPGNNSNVSTRNVTFSWTSYDATSNMSSDLIIDGLVNVSNISTNNGTPTNYTVLGLSEGPHNWSIQTWDDAGNSNNSSVYEFTVDTPPTITITSPENKTYNITSIDLNYSVEDSSGIDWVGYSLDGTSNITTSGEITTFSNSTGGDLGSAVNITFNQSGSNTSVYIKVPKNATVYSASMDVSGYGTTAVTTKDPTSTSVDSAGWASPTDTYTSDDLYAYTKTIRAAQRYYDYGFSLSGANITKVEIGVEQYTDSNDWIDVDVSWDGGTTWSSTVSATISPPGVDDNQIEWLHFTSSTSWTPDKLNDTNFRVRVEYKWTGGRSFVYLDYIPVRVTHFSYPTNLTIDTGNDTIIDWSMTGELNPTNSPMLVSDLDITAINDYLSTCTEDAQGNCLVPLNISSDSAGIVQLDALSVKYYSNTTLTNLSDGQHNVTVYANDTVGNLNSSTVWFTVGEVVAPPTNLTITYNNDRTINLTWNGGAASYDIFITNNYSAGFDPGPNVTGITDKNWTDENASLYNQRYYRVGAGGGVAGDETVGKFDIELYPGLNFVSLPLIPHNSSMGNVTHQNASFYPVIEIARLDASGDYDIATFYPENPPEYWWSSDNLTTLENDKGFWFNVTQDYNFTQVGVVPTSNRAVNLTQGFNLAGWTSLEERKLWNATNQSSSDYNVTEIASLSASGEYTISTFYPGNSPNYWWSSDNFDALEPSKGYWFNVNQTFMWTYTPENG